jgi:hypothetical protein
MAFTNDEPVVDMLVFAIDYPPPATLILISGDRDFAYAVSVLRHRRYQIVLIAPPLSHHSLRSQASIVFDWDSDIVAKVSSESSPEPARNSPKAAKRDNHGISSDLYHRSCPPNAGRRVGDGDGALDESALQASALSYNRKDYQLQASSDPKMSRTPSDTVSWSLGNRQGPHGASERRLHFAAATSPNPLELGVLHDLGPHAQISVTTNAQASQAPQHSFRLRKNSRSPPVTSERPTLARLSSLSPSLPEPIAHHPKPFTNNAINPGSSTTLGSPPPPSPGLALTDENLFTARTPSSLCSAARMHEDHSIASEPSGSRELESSGPVYPTQGEETY